MDSPSPLKYPNRDGLPLSQLSPERVSGRSAKQTDNDNATSFPYQNTSPHRTKHHFGEPASPSIFANAIPQSPSLPEFSAIRSHLRANTDVSGLVKRFEHLDVRDRDAESSERRRKQEEALSRAKIAREEAESEAKRWRDEARTQHKELEECKDRERRVCKRVEVLMDEISRAKDQWSSQSAVYEKEVRRARKEAFKSSSAVLKLQEDAKASRTDLRAMQGKLDLAQRKAAKCEEDTFSAQYQLVAAQEEFEKLQTRLRVVEEERDALKTNLQEGEVVRIAAEGRIALPPVTEDCDTDLSSSPRKVVKARGMLHMADEDKENAGVVTKQMADTRTLQKQLLVERRKLRAAADMIEFLRLECRFQCCRCQVKEKNHAGESIDEAAKTQTQSAKAGLEISIDREGRSVTQEPEDTMVTAVEMNQDQVKSHEVVSSCTPETPAEGDDRSLTLAPDDDDRSEDPPHPTPFVEEVDEEMTEADQAEQSPAEQSRSSTPVAPPHDTLPHDARQHGSICTVTTTTKVPMHFTPISKAVLQQPWQVAESSDTERQDNCVPSNATETAGTKIYPFDREAALAAIAYRRGRAKSFAQGNLTPRRQMVEGVKERRDISAPAITG